MYRSFHNWFVTLVFIATIIFGGHLVMPKSDVTLQQCHWHCPGCQVEVGIARLGFRSASHPGTTMIAV